MTRPSRLARAVPTLLLVLLAGCPTGWRLARVEGERPSVHPGLWDEIHAIAETIESEPPDSVCSTYRRPLVHCAAAKTGVTDPFDLCRQKPNISTVATPEESALTSLWSFVHMSDVQLKEHRVTMEGAISTAAYDGLTNGALRHPQLERHDDAVFLATVMAINALESTDGLRGAIRKPPRFVLHTGDAVDVGLFSELTQFLAAVNELRLPLYNALGNHDSLFFGAFPFEHMAGTNVLLPYVPIYDTDRFMRFHSTAAAETDLTIPFQSRQEPHEATSLGMAYPPRPVPPPENLSEMPPAERIAAIKANAAANEAVREAIKSGKGRDGPPSNFHGFDVACYRGRVNGPAGGGLCPEARGYYSFDVDLPSCGAQPRKLRFVILNTSEVVPETVNEGFWRLARGNVQPEQLRWLEHELTRGAVVAPADGPPRQATVYTLVAGHHQLSSFLHDDQRERLTAILTKSPGVLAYLSGHTHQDAVIPHRREDDSILWELTAGSTLVYPQLSRVVELLEDSSTNHLWLRVATFRQQLGDHVAELEQADPASGCTVLARRAKLGRQGAHLDHDDDRVEEATAVQRANGLFPVLQQDQTTCPTPP